MDFFDIFSKEPNKRKKKIDEQYMFFTYQARNYVFHRRKFKK